MKLRNPFRRKVDLNELHQYHQDLHQALEDLRKLNPDTDPQLWGNQFTVVDCMQKVMERLLEELEWWQLLASL